MSRSYRLALGAGNEWTLSAEPDLQEWLDRFAAILELQGAGNGSSRRLHCRSRDWPFERKKPGEMAWVTSSGKQVLQFDRTTRFTIALNGDIDAEILYGLDPEIDTMNMWVLLYPLYLDVVRKGGAPVHAALALRDGKAWLLAGRGGAGKSTCSRRLLDGWQSLCDDEALVVRGADGRYNVHPMPTWSELYYGWKPEKTWPAEASFPLGGVFFIEQAPENRVESMRNPAETTAQLQEAAMHVWSKFPPLHPSGSGFTRQVHTGIFNNVCEIAHRLPAYRLEVSLKGKFWKEMERAIDNSQPSAAAAEQVALRTEQGC